MEFILTIDNIKLIKTHYKIWVYLLSEIARTSCRELNITFDKLAKKGGYANRSGARKYIKKLESAGVVVIRERGKLLVNIPVIV